MVFFSGCATIMFWKKSDEAKQKRKDFLQNKKEIEKIKNDDAFYVGEGIVQIKITSADAIKEAKKEARKELTKTIEVKIEATIVDVIGKRARESYEWFESKTKSYSDIVLRDIPPGKYFLYYPTEKSVTYLLRVSKKKYEESVKRDIEGRKKRIMGSVRPGLEAMDKKDFALALNHFLGAKELFEESFGNTSLETKIEDTNVELNSYINGKIIALINGITITPLDERITYSAEGKVSRKPRVSVVYIDERKKKSPVPSIHLLAKFTKGEGQITSRFNADINGIGQLPIEYLNPEIEESIIEIKLDMEKIGAGAEKISIVPSCSIKFSKTKTVAISVVFLKKGHKTTPSDLLNEIKTVFLDKAFGVTEYNIKRKTVSEEDKQNARNSLYADYLLSIETKASGGGPDMYGMYWSYSSGSVMMYSLSDGSEIFTFSIPSTKGEHVTSSGAAWDAFGKIKPVLLRKLKQNIDKMR